MTPLPKAYAWLQAVDDKPRMVEQALALYGTLEAPGAADNPVILSWAAEVGVRGQYSHDSIPWCGLFLALVAKRAGKDIPETPLWALSWAAWASPSPEAALGDVLVFKRQGGGHVGLYVGEDEEAFHVLGGNTADAVGITRISRARLVRARRPLYHVQPAGVRPFHLAATGLLSTNEA